MLEGGEFITKIFHWLPDLLSKFPTFPHGGV
jgi:hypothetical protein